MEAHSGGTRDYRAWHTVYDDPTSGMSWRLGVVQDLLRDALDRHPGDIRVMSSCAGDARDVLGVLADRPDAGRVSTTLLELDPVLSGMARRRAAERGLTRVEVRTVDAGTTDAYVDAVPADVVVLVGIFGNIDDDDLRATIAAAPQFCRPGATLVWSRARGEVGDRDADVRRWFEIAGFSELAHRTREGGSRPAVGCVRYDGPRVALETARRLFTFVR